jgi:hypothetical protein
MKAYSLTSALDGGEWSASLLGRFTPRASEPFWTQYVAFCLNAVSELFHFNKIASHCQVYRDDISAQEG